MFIFLKFEIFSEAIVEPLRRHFAKIAHKLTKSKYFSNILNESYSPLNSLFNDTYSLLGSISSFENYRKMKQYRHK